jgi:HSP90 family molecular chaperone
VQILIVSRGENKMSENWVKKPVEWTIKDIGAPLLDSLAGGLYSKFEVFREYVQNAVDSYVDFEQETGRTPQNTVQVWVDSDNAALHIKDDGIGMDWEDIKTAKAIAVSPKLIRFNEFVGFRGLGMWSGLSACEKLVLTTTKVGIPYAYRLIIDCKGIVEHYQDPFL